MTNTASRQHRSFRLAVVTLCMFVCLGAAALMIPAGAAASSLPVFRYALEHWQPETYDLVVVYRDGLTTEEQAVADWLEKNSHSQLPGANYTVREIDIDSSDATDIPALMEYRESDDLPMFALLPPPGGTRTRHIICKGPLSLETAQILVDSPARREIAGRLVGGDSVVWVLVESGNTLRDAEAIRTLDTALAKMNERYGVTNTSASGDGFSMEMPVNFTWMQVRRHDPLETYTIDILLDGAPPETDDGTPEVIPVYGRGRALGVYPGDTLDEEAIDRITAYLAGPCGDETKTAHQGYDLMIPTDWDRNVTAAWILVSDPSRGDGITLTSLTSLFVPPSPVTAIVVIVLAGLVASLVMNIRQVMVRPKEACLRCGKEHHFPPDSRKLCRSCAPGVDRELASIGEAIRTAMRQISKTRDREEIGNHCAVIVEKAKKALEYTERGIPLPGLNPSDLIEQYTARLDSLLMEPDAPAIKKALTDAHEALAPFVGIASMERAFTAVEAARKILGNRGLTAQVIAFINQKGGVGKTTSTINVGAGLSQLGKRVLLVDFDPQANLTDGMGIAEDELSYSVYDFLMGQADPKKVIIRKNGMAVIPAHMMLTRFEQESRDAPDRNNLLSDALKNAGDFDYILIDCPPTLGFLTLNALTAAQDIFVPFVPEYFALKGIRKTLHIIDYVRKSGNADLSMRGVVATRFDGRKLLHQEVVDKIEKSFGEKLYHMINEDISLSEASSYGQSIFEYQPSGRGAEDYKAFCQKIVDGKRANIHIDILPED